MNTHLRLHVRELRHRLAYAALCLGALGCVCYAFSGALLYLCVLPVRSTFLCTGMTEAFHTHISIAVQAGLYAWLAYACYAAWAFARPSLYAHEQARWASRAATCVLLVYASLAAAHLMLVPLASSFLLGSCGSDPLVPLSMDPRISSYMGLRLTLWCAGHGLALAPAALLTTGVRLRRPWVYLACLLAVALMSPPDPAVQGVLSLGSWALAEGLLLLSHVGASYAR